MIMKHVFLILISFIAIEVSAQNWEIKEDYEITFSGTKAEGSFGGLKGTIQFDPNDLINARFNVLLEVSSIATGNKTKNKHARSENWLYAEVFPEIRFSSTQITKAPNGYVAVGQLDLRGVQQEVYIPFTFSNQGEEAVFQGTLQVNRKDFGIEGNFMEFLVGDEFKVKIRVSVKAVIK